MSWFDCSSDCSSDLLLFVLHFQNANPAMAATMRTMIIFSDFFIMDYFFVNKSAETTPAVTTKAPPMMYGP